MLNNLILSSLYDHIYGKANIYDSLFSIFKQESTRENYRGTRLKNLAIQKANYGETIPTIYGTMRTAGNIIWCSKVREVTTDTNYNYYMDIAIGICKGANGNIKMKLNKIWADSKELNLVNYTYRFYEGNETQLPDPLFPQNSPAYRGLCYIIFENLPLTDFNNHLPNFTFEISRTLTSENDIENKIEGINIIPACGEFVYDPEIISKVKGMEHYGEWHPNGELEPINANTFSGKADVVASMEQLKDTLSNCNYISVMTAWFGNSLNLADCEIKPKVEYKSNEPTTELWQVANYTRENAEVVGNDNGNIRYGGTISDHSIIKYLNYLRTNNYKIMFNPILLMDVENKVWRGYLTGEQNNLEQFFQRYRQFILHYANLCKNKVDAFLIGSELKGITKINGATDYFIALSKQVREILGNNVKISYAADWSEYHHTEGGWYNLDKLWASEYIDFVGIDAYFPLTNKKQEQITINAIKQGWENYKEQPEYDELNIKWWWENRHRNPDGKLTEWIPCSKKIWFCEYGFASVDGTTNEPNKFYDPLSSDGGLPTLSKGKMSYTAQRMGIQATLEFWQNSDIVERKFLYCWDARPFPAFPYNLDRWSDGANWKYGHWVNGKAGLLTFENLLKMLCLDAEIGEELFTSNVYETIEGICINEISSINSLLYTLQKVYNYMYYERNGKLHIENKNFEPTFAIQDGNFVVFNDGEFLKQNIVANLPTRLYLSFLNRETDYEISIIYESIDKARTRQNINELKFTNAIKIINFPFLLHNDNALTMAKMLLYNLHNENILLEFRLNQNYLHLKVNDVIEIEFKEYKYIERENEITKPLRKIKVRILETKIENDYSMGVKGILLTI